LKLAEQAFKKARAAGVPIVFGSAPPPRRFRTASRRISSRTTQNGYEPGAGVTNRLSSGCHHAELWLGHQVGSIEKGKFADIIAVSGNPLTDVTEMERVKFVMKGGMIVRTR